MKAARIVFLVLSCIFFAVGIAMIFTALPSITSRSLFNESYMGYRVTMRSYSYSYLSLLSPSLMAIGALLTVTALFFGVITTIIWLFEGLHREDAKESSDEGKIEIGENGSPQVIDVQLHNEKKE